MNLHQTVQELRQKPTSVGEAMAFANEQFGTLCAYLKSKQKEYRVYVASADDYFTNAYNIENWKHYENHHNKLTQEAEEFIKFVEQSGEVYSLEGFMNALNLEEINLNNSWVYITNV